MGGPAPVYFLYCFSILRQFLKPVLPPHKPIWSVHNLTLEIFDTAAEPSELPGPGEKLRENIFSTEIKFKDIESRSKKYKQKCFLYFIKQGAKMFNLGSKN